MFHNSKRLHDLQNSQRSGGFTLIELMLAMVFVAFILVFISLTLVQMFRIYDKGSSMKQVNQAGRSMVEDITQAIRSQLPANIKTDAVNSGILCIDKVMYVWNPLYTADTGPIDTTPNPDANRSVIGDVVNGGMMARKVLSNATTCPSNLSDALDTTLYPVTQETQLLSGQTRVVRSKVTRLDERLVKLEFIIGTYSRAEIVNNTPKYITPTRPDAGGDIACLAGDAGNYCSFAEFSTVVYLSN